MPNLIAVGGLAVLVTAIQLQGRLIEEPKRCSYATVLIDAETRQRVDVLSDRKADTLQGVAAGAPGVQVVCRDGSGAYAEAVRRALPGAQ